MNGIRNVISEVTGDIPKDEEKPKDGDAPTEAADQSTPDDTGIPEDILSSLPTTEAPPEEEQAPPAEDDELSKLLESDEPPKENKAWAKVKHQNKEYAERVKELEEQLASVQKLPEETIKEYQDRIDAMDKQIAEISLEKSEAFKREYDYPIMETAARAAKLIEQNAGKSPDEARAMVQQAAAMNFSDRNRFLLDEVPELSGVVNTLLLSIDEKRDLRGQALEKAQATDMALKESEEKVKKVQSIREIEESLLSAAQDAATAGNLFFQKSKATGVKAQAWNENIDMRTESLKQIKLKGSAKDIDRLIVDGSVFPKLLDMYNKARMEIAALKKENEDVSASQPSVSSRSIPPKTENAPQGAGVNAIIGHVMAGGKL